MTRPTLGSSLEELVNGPAWRRSAACRGADPDLFFPERGSHRPVEALAYCEECSVRSECLASALNWWRRRWVCGEGRPGGVARAYGGAWRSPGRQARLQSAASELAPLSYGERVEAPRARHPKKDLEEILATVEAAGWRLRRKTGYYKAYYPCGLHLHTVHLSPSDPYYKRSLQQWFRRQPCWPKEQG